LINRTVSRPDRGQTRPGAHRSEPLRVCLYIDSRAYGGAERVLLDLVACLDRRSWEPVLLYQPGADTELLASSAVARGATLVAAPPLPEGVEGVGRLRAWVRQLRRLDPAVFHAQLTWPMAGKFALLGALIARVPAISCSVCSFPVFSSTASARFQRRILVSAIGTSTTLSCYIARELTQVLGWPSSKIRVVYPGVDVREFECRDQPQRTARSSNGSTKTVLAVARLDPMKGLATLIDAAKDMPYAQIRIAGEGPDRPRLEDLARVLGVEARVTFLGHRSDVPQLLAAADVFALPSLNEGLGLAALEAMAASRPVVASSVGGIPEVVVQGETGILVPPNDPRALAQALNDVLADARLAERMGAAGRRRVQAEFSADRAAQETAALWSELLGS
jgi:glycosyltransferase involved in cell wall biosynthesis